ncbi:hypothetical protein PM082_021720 [Marasmius tenuissimus]|nr:hypothetical protein PM082_021720 [Marasmius tenuissimus]
MLFAHQRSRKPSQTPQYSSPSLEGFYSQLPNNTPGKNIVTGYKGSRHVKKRSQRRPKGRKPFLLVDNMDEDFVGDLQERQSATVFAQRELPFELLHTIFSIACSSFDSGYTLILNKPDFIRTSSTAFPVTLSQVCSRWRDVALSTPSLWSAISLRLSALPLFSTTILEHYLQNSKQHPLKVQITAGLSPREPLPAEAISVWAILTPHLPRVQSLYCNTRPLWMQGTSFPNLTTLQDFLLERDNRWHSFLRDVPRLTEVTTFILYPSSTFPYSQLTSLECRHQQGSAIIQLIHEVLPVCQKLEALTIGLDSSRGGEQLAIQHRIDAVLPSLRVFVLTDHDSGISMNSFFFTVFFASLHTPALHELRIECGDAASSVGWAPPFLEFLAQSGSTLRHLSLSLHHTGYPEAQPLSHPFERVPNLTRFELVMVDGSWNASRRKAEYRDHVQRYVSRLFVDLMVGDRDPTSSEALVPKLSTLIVSAPGVALDSETVNSGLRVALARRPGTSFASTSGRAPLKEVRFALCRDAYTKEEEKSTEAVGVLRQDGVDVDIKDLR